MFTFLAYSGLKTVGPHFCIKANVAHDVVFCKCGRLPCPDCSAPRQSPGRKSKHNSRTLQRAGNEVLRERQRQRVEVFFCSVTTTARVEYFRDLYKAVYE